MYVTILPSPSWTLSLHKRPPNTWPHIETSLSGGGSFHPTQLLTTHVDGCPLHPTQANTESGQPPWVCSPHPTWAPTPCPSLPHPHPGRCPFHPTQATSPCQAIFPSPPRQNHPLPCSGSKNWLWVSIAPHPSPRHLPCSAHLKALGPN